MIPPSSPRRRSIAAPIALGVALLLLVGIAIQRMARSGDDEPAFGSSQPEGRVLADFGGVEEFALVDEEGRSVTREDLLGRIWVADFFFTTCPGPCLALTTKMSALHRAIAALPGVELVSFTVDPETDTPQVLKRYAQLHGDDERWRWLTGERATLERVAKSFLTNFGRKDETGNISHQTYLYVVDRAGRLRAFHDTQADENWKAAVLHSVKLLVEQQPQETSAPR